MKGKSRKSAEGCSDGHLPLQTPACDGERRELSIHLPRSPKIPLQTQFQHAEASQHLNGWILSVLVTCGGIAIVAFLPAVSQW